MIQSHLNQDQVVPVGVVKCGEKPIIFCEILYSRIPVPPDGTPGAASQKELADVL